MLKLASKDRVNKVKNVCGHKKRIDGCLYCRGAWGSPVSLLARQDPRDSVSSRPSLKSSPSLNSLVSYNSSTASLNEKASISSTTRVKRVPVPVVDEAVIVEESQLPAQIESRPHTGDISFDERLLEFDYVQQYLKTPKAKTPVSVKMKKSLSKKKKTKVVFDDRLTINGFPNSEQARNAQKPPHPLSLPATHSHAANSSSEISYKVARQVLRSSRSDANVAAKLRRSSSKSSLCEQIAPRKSSSSASSMIDDPFAAVSRPLKERCTNSIRRSWTQASYDGEEVLADKIANTPQSRFVEDVENTPIKTRQTCEGPPTVKRRTSLRDLTLRRRSINALKPLNSPAVSFIR